MKKSVLEQSREFINSNSKKNNFVFSSKEIKTTIKNFLSENNYLISPIKNIFILKKSEQKLSEIIEKYKFNILERLLENGGVLSGEFLINYYLGKTNSSRIFRIITKSKNFESYLGEEENIKIIFKPSLIPRITKKILILNNKLEIEEKLSFIINNYYLFKDNKDFQKIILEAEFNIKEIENLINKKFKFSSISKIAIFYKNSGKTAKYNIIIQAIKNKGKKIDRRGTKLLKKPKTSETVDLNNLF
ncbi:MAG: hypothetical protein Q9M94_05185 [Candidatus Gracilibacteria bacterium]|nr:hypothetical protein [Candidatus Gracilibacteria bacterium]MDQ7021918.1 hypothetical protein [Candidatus Gracilibacteria bacterium]